MIRVLHVIGDMGAGGAQAFIMNYYRNVDRNKVQFDFAVRSYDKKFFDDEIEELGGKLYRVPWFNVKNYFSYKRFWENFFKEHPEIDIVHGHLGSSAQVYLSVAKKYGKIAIAHSHSVAPKKKDLYNYIYKIFSYPTRYIADYLFACGKNVGIDRYGKKKKVFIVPNAIDVESFLYNEENRKKIRNELKINDNFVIGHVGRFYYPKNHEFMIDIFKEINIKNPNSKLLLVGSGELMEKIKEKVKSLNLEKDVIFVGAKNNVNEYLSAMDLFLFPSIFEGLPVALIEAEASGIKCISSTNVPKESDVTGLVDFIDLNDKQKWIDAVLNIEKDYKRISTIDMITKAGYNIKEKSNWLTDFYIKANNERTNLKK